MHLVDRHRRIERIDIGGRRLRLRQFRRVDHDRGGGRAHFAGESDGIGLQRQHVAVLPDDLIFVLVVGARAGGEYFPIAVAAHAHGVAAAVPKIEVADDADPASVRRPHHEGNAGHAIEHHRMRAELVVKAQMVAFAEQIEIVVGEHRRKAVGIFQFHVIVAEAGAQPVMFPAVERTRKQPGRIDTVEFAFAAVADRNHPLGVRQKNAQHGFIVLGVRPEIAEGVGMAAGDDLAGGGRQFGHGLITPPRLEDA